MAQIITLTTDLGTRDHYAASLKGAMYRHCANCNVADVSHHVNAFNIGEAAFILRNVYQDFPVGTIHIVSVSDHDDADCRYLAVKHNDHYFIGSDNGVFSMAFGEEPELAYEPDLLKGAGSNSYDAMAQVAAYLADGNDIAQIGRPIYEVRRRANLEPVLQENLIRASVIYVDRFENVVTNITRDLFTKAIDGKRFVFFFKRNERITHVSEHFHEVQEGEKLCIFNSAGFLEIAINKGKASSLLGLTVGDTVQIDIE